MNTISVTADRNYEVVIDIDWQKAIEPYLPNRGQVAVIVSEAMRDRIVNLPVTDAQIHVFTVPDSEAGKSFATYQKVLDWLGAAGFTRNDLVIAVGGGAVTDLSGFVASSWLRCIDWVAVPTTLAAMVDAAVGGKTGINSEYGAITFNVGAGSHLAIAEKILIPLTFKRVSLESIIRVQQRVLLDIAGRAQRAASFQ